MEPVNTQWQIGSTRGKSWRALDKPDLCFLEYFMSFGSEYALESGREEVLAGNKVPKHYKSLTSALYATHGPNMRAIDALRKMGRFPTLVISVAIEIPRVPFIMVSPRCFAALHRPAD